MFFILDWSRETLWSTAVNRFPPDSAVLNRLVGHAAAVRRPDWKPAPSTKRQTLHLRTARELVGPDVRCPSLTPAHRQETAVGRNSWMRVDASRYLQRSRIAATVADHERSTGGERRRSRSRQVGQRTRR